MDTEIGAPTRNRVKSEQFIVSKIDARNGAFVLVPEFLDGAVVTSDFPVFDVNAEDFNRVLAAEFHRITSNAPRRPMREVAPLVRRPVKIEDGKEYPELGVRSFGRGTFHKPALSAVELGDKRIFWIKPDDLVFSNVFAWEGAVAVSSEADDGRVGSHRFMTCVVNAEIATSNFLRFFYFSEEGLKALGEASSGGAGRNRTLGITGLEAIEIPIPPLPHQHAFDALCEKFTRLRAA